MSSTVNVLRYSFLGAGIAYGAYARFSGERAEHKAIAAAQWKKDERLIREAKREYARLHKPVATKTSSSLSINWEDPNLDLDTILLAMDLS